MRIFNHLRKRLSNNKGLVGTSIAIGSAVLGGTLAGGAALTGAAALGAGLVGGATLLTAGLGVAQLAGGLFGGGQDSFQSPGALPAAPTFEEAQGTSLEEQRENLRRKSQTTLTDPNLLETAQPTEKKTLLGA